MRLALTLFFTAISLVNVYANNVQYEQRRTDYINTALSNPNTDAIAIQAYMNQTDTNLLNSTIALIPTKSTIDFDIVKLVRAMYLAGGIYDNKIFSALDTLPFWIRKNQWLYGYWSENHMIMWMSSEWLLHEKFNRPTSPDLDKRLRHYLRLKIKYGFYEFFSSVYNPYCLSGLLNLADFAQDAEIKQLATQASVRLLREMLMLTNDKGVFYPVAGRNYYGKYLTPYGQNHNNLIWLLTGMGNAPTAASHAGSFLATSSLFVDTIADQWLPKLDLTYTIGHPIDSFASIHSNMSQIDKVMFQWSAGAYFHPKIAFESAVVIRDSNLWNHVDFTDYKQFSFFSAEDAPELAEYAKYASYSSVNCGQNIVVYKNNSVSLYSIKDFWKGKLGHQQFSCVATVGNSPVVIASGKINKDWELRSSGNAQEHQPYVLQKKNAAMLMYRQEPVPAILKYKNPEVALLFKDAEYDEIRTHNLWLLGRQGENYVAVRRYCLGEIDSVRACPEPKGQTWLLMVGDSSLYGNFNNFEAVIQQSTFTDDWSLDTSVTPWQHNYHAKAIIGTDTFEYTWQRDSVIETSIQEPQVYQLRLFPNPATDNVQLDLNEFSGEDVAITVTNLKGAVVHRQYLLAGQQANTVTIPTKHYAKGIYFFAAQSKNRHANGKLLVE